jgi:hypothetical protein
LTEGKRGFEIPVPVCPAGIPFPGFFNNKSDLLGDDKHW